MALSKQPVVRPEFSPLSIVRMVWKRKLMIPLVWITCSALAGGIVWMLPPVYTAEALILVDSQKIPDKYVASTVSTDLQDRLATISQQILSSTRLKKIIDDFDLYREEKKTHVQEEILEMMRKDVTIKLEKGWASNKPGAFRVGYQGKEPTIVAQVANRMANFFIEENLKTREVQAEGTSEFIDTQLQEAKRRLDELEAAVSKYKLQHNGGLPEQEQSIAANLGRMQTQLQSCRDAMGRAENTRLMLENTLTVTESTAAALAGALAPKPASAQQATVPAAMVPAAPGTAAPAAEGGAETPQRDSNSIEALEKQLDLYRGRYSDDHPDIKRLKALIVRAREVERKYKKEDAAGGRGKTAAGGAGGHGEAAGLDPKQSFELGQARERVSAIKAQIEMTAKEIEARKAEEKQLMQAINNLQARLDRLPIREQEMAAITRDYEMSKANYKSLLDKKFSAEMSTDMERRQKSERFTILDPARVPEKPFKPNRPLLAGLGTLVSLGLGLGLAFGLELPKNALLGEWELPEGTAVLGRIPFIVMQPAVERPRKRLRLLLVSAGAVCLAVMIAAGGYYVWGRY
jgi:succinoglycan biosynthesis transport protein ExoP